MKIEKKTGDWQVETRNEIINKIGGIPKKSTVEVRKTGEEPTENYLRESLLFRSYDGTEIPAFILIPNGLSGPVPGVMCLHQHNNEYHLGKSEPAGLMGNPGQSYAHDLAKQGYVTFAFDRICFEERQDDKLKSMDFERFEFFRWHLNGKSMQSRIIADAMCAVSVLQSRPEVDPERIASIGHSMGGQQTLFLAAMDERIKVMVSSCGFALMSAIIRDKIIHNYPAYLYGLMEKYDMDVLLKLCAPRPFLIAAGGNDPIFPRDGITGMKEKAEVLYEQYGKKENLEVYLEDCGHDFTPGMHKKAYEWIIDRL